MGKQLYDQSRGIDYTQLINNRLRQSVSCDINYGIRLTTVEEFSSFIRTLADELQSKLTAAQMDALAITLKLMIRSPDAPIEPAKFMGHGRCDTYSKSTQLGGPFCEPTVIHREVMKLYETQKFPIEDIRGIGVQLTKLCPKTAAGIAAQKKKDFFLPRKRPQSDFDSEASNPYTVKWAPKKKPDFLPTRPKEDIPVGLEKCMMTPVFRQIVRSSMDSEADQETTRALVEYFYYRVQFSIWRSSVTTSNFWRI
ncbi:hypothetical protein L596_001462 [Steinernema carpocapsae]|uniref:DNA repair protein REV1 n=1 Tax=Steinernema carpocapsae TaxID=34508 RepID=A0A4U8ULB7_STECR|nr:hypothetical protein L596_001462 [Steinernema carpocapsae]